MATYIKCPYPHCQKDINFDSLSKNEWSASYGAIEIHCPYCGLTFGMDMGSSAAMQVKITMNVEKYLIIIARKEAEMEGVENEIRIIRKYVSAVDYSEFELNNKDYFQNKLPERIIYKLRPLWDKLAKLRVECNCIEDMIKDFENHDG